MKPWLTPDQIRANIAAEADQRGYSLAGLSRVLKRSDSYMQRYVREGLPERLSDHDRARLARFMGVDGAVFGMVTVKPPRPRYARR